jgi:Mg2+/citrate symporter
VFTGWCDPENTRWDGYRPPCTFAIVMYDKTNISVPGLAPALEAGPVSCEPWAGRSTVTTSQVRKDHLGRTLVLLPLVIIGLAIALPFALVYGVGHACCILVMGLADDPEGRS